MKKLLTTIVVIGLIGFMTSCWKQGECKCVYSDENLQQKEWIIYDYVASKEECRMYEIAYSASASATGLYISCRWE